MGNDLNWGYGNPMQTNTMAGGSYYPGAMGGLPTQMPMPGYDPSNTALMGMGGGGGGGNTPYDPTLWDKLFGWNEDGVQRMGVAPLALNAITGIGNTFLGMKQYGLAKDSLEQSKRQFDLNFGTQAKLTNARMRTRQDRRNRESGSAMSTADYMANYGVKTDG